MMADVEDKENIRQRVAHWKREGLGRKSYVVCYVVLVISVNCESSVKRIPRILGQNIELGMIDYFSPRSLISSAR